MPSDGLEQRGDLVNVPRALPAGAKPPTVYDLCPGLGFIGNMQSTAWAAPRRADPAGGRAGEPRRRLPQAQRHLRHHDPAGRAFLQIRAAFAEMERNLIRQRISEGIAAARARGRKGGRPRVMPPEKLHYTQHLMADRTRRIPAICRELGDMPASTLYHYLHAGGSRKAPGRKLLGTQTRANGEDLARGPRGDAAGIDRPRARALA